LALAVLAANGACAAGLSQPSAAAPSVDAAGSSLHPGVRHSTLTRGDDQVFVAQVLEPDLTQPNLALITTPANPDVGMEFVAMSTSRFLDARDAVAAINASYFLPFAGGTKGGDDYYPHEGQPVTHRARWWLRAR